ncbi:MAG: hypothetical protein ACLGIF_00395, partial [Actinomycetes bacterium]
MSLGRRLAAAAAAFGGTSVALLAFTVAASPGWRPAPLLAPLDPAPPSEAAAGGAYEVAQVKATVTAAGADLPAWVVRPVGP